MCLKRRLPERLRQLRVNVAAGSDRPDEMTGRALRPREVVVAAQRTVDQGGGVLHGTLRARLAKDGELGHGAEQDDRLLVGHGQAAARSANFAYRFRNESLIESVGPLRCLARCTSARPC